MRKTWKTERKGVVVLYTTLTLCVMFPLMGLAIDVGTLYMIRTKLSASVDSAALAGARSLNAGADVASQAANAQSVAQKFFNANFPSGYWSTTNVQTTFTVDSTTTRVRRVTATASVDAPLYFLRVLGQNTSKIAVTGQAARRDVNLMLVLDRSGSLARAGACGIVRDDANLFVNKFADGRDYVGLVTFGGSSMVPFPIAQNFKSASPSIADQIAQIDCNGSTNSSHGLYRAYQQLKSLNMPGALNVIVFFTDGRPTAMTGTFPVRTTSDGTYGVSGCTNPAPKTGFMAGYVGIWDDTGPTFGLLPPDAVAVSNSAEYDSITDSSGCAFQVPAGYDTDQSSAYPYLEQLRYDIAYIPDADAFGNSTMGYKATSTIVGGPYDGHLRVDSPLTIRGAAYNTADNMAQTIRRDPLGIMILTVGLGGTDAEGIDHEFLRRVANDPASPIYDSTQPTGVYFYSPNAYQLNDAFNKVASFILRLTM